MKKYICYFTAIIIFSLTFDTATLFPGSIRTGQVGFRFLEQPVSAEAVGRGGMGVVMFRNANSVFWNPAGLSWMVGSVDFNLNYTDGIADINHSSIVGAIKIGNFGYLSLDGLIMDYGELKGTRRANNDKGYVMTGTFSPQAYAIGATLSQRVSDRFSYGVRLKSAKQDLGTAYIGRIIQTDSPDSLEISTKKYSLTEPALDVGAIYDFQSYGLRFGAVMQNVSRETKYEENSFPLPYAVNFSLSVTPLSFLNTGMDARSLRVGFETRHPRDTKERLQFGAEYSFQELAILRLGYMGNYDERGLTFGLGLRQEYFNSNLRIDYAYQDFGIFNAVHVITFGVTR